MESKITFFGSFYETAKKLPTAEERERYLMGLLGYALEGVEPDFSDSLILDIAFTNARPNIDASARRARVAKENGQAGGRPETKPETNCKTNRKTNQKTNAKKAKTRPLQEKDMDKDKDMEVETPYSLENTEFSTYAADGAGSAKAAPPPDVSVSPHCPQCGRLLLLTQRGFECDEHEVIPIGEVAFR